MKKKISFLVLISVAALFLFSGCTIKSKTDISIRETVTIVGVDEVDGVIKLTITIELVQPPESNGASSSVAIYTAEGNSMFDAIQKFHAYTDKIIFWGHVNYILIGEDTAKLGINKYIDLFARDHEVKQNMKVVIVKESTAEDFIKDTNLKDAPLNDVLTSLFDDPKNLSNDSEVSILQYLHMVSCKKNCLYIPSVTTTDKKEKSEDDEGKKDVKLDGYALFDDDALKTYLEGDNAKGVNWIIDKSHAGYITITDKKGDIVVVEVTKNKPSFEVDFSGDVPEAKITINFNTNIVEYHGSEDIFINGQIDHLIKEQNKVVEEEIVSAIKFLQENKTDMIGVCNKVYTKYPKKTDSFDGIWPEVFAKTKISVKIESSIDRTYNINQPVAHDEKEDEQ